MQATKTTHTEPAHSHEHHDPGFLRSYVFSTDHKVIGIQYGFTALSFLLFGFLLMICMRWQMAKPGEAMPIVGKLLESLLGEVAKGGIISPDLYNAFGAMHGTIMVFLAIVPLAFAAFGNYVVPLQIGAVDMAFPRVNMVSYQCFAVGGVIMFVSFFIPGGAAQAGWTSYSPLATVIPTQGQTFWILGLVIFLAVGLNRDPREIPSPLVGKPAPAFSLNTLDANAPKFGPQDMKGKVWMLNVWATWCVACREEHPVLVAFSKANQLPIVGLSYKEVQPQDEPAGKKFTPEEKLQFARDRSALWLKRHGNPYVLSAMDLDGRVGIDYGVYGVPETYVIDKEGVIRYKRVGVVTPELLQSTILPLVQKLSAS